MAELKNYILLLSIFFIIPLISAENSTSGNYGLYTATTIAGINSTITDYTLKASVIAFTNDNGSRTDYNLSQGYIITLEKQVIAVYKLPLVAISAIGAALTATITVYIFFRRRRR